MRIVWRSLVALALVLLLTATAGSAAGVSGGIINNDSAAIGVMTQEYSGDNIAEILMIQYDGSQPALAEFGGKNPELESRGDTGSGGVETLLRLYAGPERVDPLEQPMPVRPL